ncbi:MAG: GspH/FimT family pseudopilin [Deltaproteobacteria bacterium]|nr:GspH/FimT family pseudopilin [Deltaproteobacteria bacterium]
MKKTQWKKTGFTLIELLMVVVLMAIISAIAMPGFLEWMAQNRLNGATRQVMTDLMEARSSAVNQNNRFRVLFVDSHRYQIHDDRNNNSAIDAGEPVVTKDIHNDYQDVTFSATATPIFYSRGTAFGTTVTLYLANHGQTKTVTVSAAGRVKCN